METQQFCLKWNSHQANMLTVFEQLLSTEALVDVTLACDGLSLKAHKVVLSACSPYFQSLFVDNPCKHPIVIMKDMRYSDLKAIIDFMYKGEVNVSHDQLNALLKTAETLKVKGLAEMSGENRAASSGTVQQNASSPPPTNIPIPQTRSDSPAMLSKRKHGRPRKRFRSGSVHSDEEVVPTKIKEPESPEIEELPQDPSESISDSIPVSSKHQTPIHSSAAVNNSHLSSRKSQSSRSSHQTEEPPSDSDFSIEPSKLMEQTLTTTPVISNGLAQSSSSGISVNTSSSLSIVPTSLSIVPAESQLSVATDSHSSNQTQGPDSPQDVKPLLSFEEPLIGVDPSQDGSSFMDSSGVPAIAGTSSSYQDDQQALVPQDSQSQAVLVKLELLELDMGNYNEDLPALEDSSKVTPDEVVRKKRGRPRKYPIGHVYGNNIAVKRKRGRPSKHPIGHVYSTPIDVGNNIAEKRKRGRPRKSQIDERNDSSQIKSLLPLKDAHDTEINAHDTEKCIKPRNRFRSKKCDCL